MSMMVVDPAKHLFTADDYHRMGEAGVFAPDARLELLGGEIIEMSPIGIPHASTVDEIGHWFDSRLGDRALVRIQGPVRISDLSEPQPDVTLLAPHREVYRVRHPVPDDVLLMIEVADSTTRWDRRVKRPLYAAAGIVEVWIVDLPASVVEVATEPTDGEFARIQRFASGDVIAPTAFPDLAFPLADLFD